MSRARTLLWAGPLLLVSAGRVQGQVEGAFAHPAAWGRAAVLGPASVAVAADQGGLYWNPAGLARLERRYHAAFSHAEVFDGLDLGHDLVSLVRSNNSWGGGIGLDRLGTSRVLRSDPQGNIEGYGSHGEARVVMAAGKAFEGLRPWTDAGPPQLGLGIHWLRVDTGSQSWSDVGLDVGGLAALALDQAFELRLGATVRNAWSTLDGASWSPTLSAAVVRKGPLLSIGCQPRSGRWTLGVSAPLAPGPLDLSLGGAIERTSGVGTSWRLGLTVGSGRGTAQYIVEDRPFLGDTRTLGVAASWGRYQFPLHFDGWRLQRDGEPVPEARLRPADEALLQIELRYPTSARDWAHRRLKLILYGPDGVVLEEVRADDLHLSDHGVAFPFQPAADWLEGSGYLLEGRYAFEILLEERVRLRGSFALEHHPEAVAAVARAYSRLESRETSHSERWLLTAARRDPSYPHTYYVAGLLSELSGDFTGAANCYREAARLSRGDPIELAGRRVDLAGLSQLEYLQKGEGSNRLFELLRGQAEPP